MYWQLNAVTESTFDKPVHVGVYVPDAVVWGAATVITSPAEVTANEATDVPVNAEELV
jgi:hypothetical protein